MDNPFKSVETEWTQIQRKFGNLPPKEEESYIEDDEEEPRDPYENANDSELREVQEESGDAGRDEEEDFLAQYRKRRMKELKELSMKPKFGSLISIRATDWESEVTCAQKDVYVVVLLYERGDRRSSDVSEVLTRLSTKYIHTKFVSVYYRDAIADFPRQLVPTVLVYFNGDISGQFTGAKQTFDIERRLIEIRAVETEDNEDEKKEEVKEPVKYEIRKK